MHEYDTVLKALLQGSQNSIFEHITGARLGRGRWLNVELPEVRQTRVDLLFEALEELRRLIALELQSTHDPLLPLRMAEYSLRVYRIHKQCPEQYVLYVGDREMRMPSELAGPNHVCRYTIIDIRKLDEEILLKSPFAADNIMAILTRHKDRRETIRRIPGANRYTRKWSAVRRVLEAAYTRRFARTGRFDSNGGSIYADHARHYGP